MKVLMMAYVLINMNVDYNDPRKENPVKSFATKKDCLKEANKRNSGKSHTWVCSKIDYH